MSVCDCLSPDQLPGVRLCCLCAGFFVGHALSVGLSSGPEAGYFLLQSLAAGFDLARVRLFVRACACVVMCCDVL